MKEVVLITGANGLVATELVKKLSSSFEIKLLSRYPSRDNEYKWDVNQNFIDIDSIKNVSHIIHLAGANVIDKRWSESRRTEIVSSRVKSADLLLEALQNQQKNVRSFISASAIGFYGNQTSERIFVEDDTKGDGFLSDVVLRWEQVADVFLTKGVAERVVKLRTGVVLSNQGGAFKKISSSVKMNLAAAFGSGKQYMPWIHIDDLCAMYKFALENNSINGVYNAVAPEQVNNIGFTKALAKAMRKPFFLPNIPSFLLKMVFGEASSALLEGTRVSPEKIINAGFEFDFPKLRTAFDDLLLSANQT